MSKKKTGLLNQYVFKGGIKQCHYGNKRIFTALEGGTLYAGGWTRGAYPYRGMAVIDLREDSDLTGVKPLNRLAKAKFQRTLDYEDTAYLSVPIQDFSAPSYSFDFWVALADDVRQILAGGEDVLVACDGGHGRTGTVLAILLQHLDPKSGNPVHRIRRLYCFDAVETKGQIEYVYEMTGFVPAISERKVEGGWQPVDDLTEEEWEAYYEKLANDDNIRWLGKSTLDKLDG